MARTYTSLEMVNAMHEAAQESGGWASCSHYEAYRRDFAPWLPSLGAITRRFSGSWLWAEAHAGLGQFCAPPTESLTELADPMTSHLVASVAEDIIANGLEAPAPSAIAAFADRPERTTHDLGEPPQRRAAYALAQQQLRLRLGPGHATRRHGAMASARGERRTPLQAA